MSILFSPAQIGNLQLRNRVVMPSMHLGYCPKGEVTERLIEFYRARARGGVGLIILGGCAIDRIGTNYSMVQLDDDAYIPGLRLLAEAVHAEGAKIMPQLYHNGRYAHFAVTGKQSVAPSAVPTNHSDQVPAELTLEQIASLKEAYVSAALRVQKAGFDGLEISASAGFLISQFLSPLTNKRTDRYGGDQEGRMRFGVEVVEVIRAAVGPDFPILVRVSGHDYMAGGNTNAESRVFCQAVEQAGADAINVTGGWHETPVPQVTMSVPPGTFVYLAQGIKQAVSIPVIACNRINTPGLAEEVLQDGLADFIGMARPLLADPEFPNKAINGDFESIRYCIGCNQGCLDQVFLKKPVFCLENAEAGREKTYGSLGKTQEPERILVVGAGPAGMEFARLAARRGHRVTIWEKKGYSGGQLNLAAIPPGRADFFNLDTYLLNSCMDLGVKFEYNVKATEERILAAVQDGRFSRVVIAAGAHPQEVDFPLDSNAEVVQAWDVLAGRVTVGENVVVIGGGAVGVGTALLLAQYGTLDYEIMHFLYLQKAEPEEELHRLVTNGSKKITLVDMERIGRDIGVTTRSPMLADLKRFKVKSMPKTTVLEVTKEGVVVEKDGEKSVLPADTVVLAVGSASNNELYLALENKVKKLNVIGDAAKPGKAMNAIHLAYAEAMKI